MGRAIDLQQGADPMTKRGPMPHWLDMPILVTPFVVVLILAVVLGLGVPIVTSTADHPGRYHPGRLTPAPIDGARAYGYLKQICAIGPRPAGSAANARQRQMVAQHFTKLWGDHPRAAVFAAVDPQSGAKVDMVNLIGAWHPERTQRVLLGVHYDTRPFPDREADPARRQIPYIGANDGGSGVALLMEIAHHLKDLPTTWGVDLVLFDGEDLVYAENGEYCLGSKEFARVYAESVEAAPGGPRYVAAVVLDMIGDKNLAIAAGAVQPELRPPAGPGGLVGGTPAQGQRLPQPRRPRGHRRSPAAERREHPGDRPHRLPAAADLAHVARPARALLGRQPRAGRQGRHRLAVAAPEQESLSGSPVDPLVRRIVELDFLLVAGCARRPGG